MNNITIKKVAVIGSGIMGSRIACHFANIGVKVLLLDICPKELSEEEKRKGLSLKDKIVRNRIVNNSFLNTLKTKPKSFYVDKNKKNISLKLLPTILLQYNSPSKYCVLKKLH